MTFPRIEWRQGPYTGANGWNTFWTVWTRSEALTPESVMAQEIAEWGWKHKRALILSIGAMLVLLWRAVTSSWMFGLAIPIVYMAAYLFTNKFPAWKRDLEYFGHAVTVQDAAGRYPEPLEYWEDMHARSLVSGFYGQFAGFTETQARAGMIAAYPQARAWLRANRKRLDKINAARPNV